MPDATQVLRFLVVGGLSTAIHLAMQHALVDRCGFGPHLAWALSFLCAFVWSWLAHHHLTFRSPHSAGSTMGGWLLRSLALQAAAFLIFTGLVHLFGGRWHLPAALAAAAAVQVVGFILAKRFFLRDGPAT
jgi:putative flippase GtrA